MDGRNNIRVGALGESIACTYLEERGFVIVERNYRKIWGEIDIIASKMGTTHFIEVKTVSREASSGFHPADNIHKRKMNRFKKAVQSYIFEYHMGECDRWQVDALLIFLNQRTKTASVEVLQHVDSW